MIVPSFYNATLKRNVSDSMVYTKPIAFMLKWPHHSDQTTDPLDANHQVALEVFIHDSWCWLRDYSPGTGSQTTILINDLPLNTKYRFLFNCEGKLYTGEDTPVPESQTHNYASANYFYSNPNWDDGHYGWPPPMPTFDELVSLASPADFIPGDPSSFSFQATTPSVEPPSECPDGYPCGFICYQLIPDDCGFDPTSITPKMGGLPAAVSVDGTVTGVDPNDPSGETHTWTVLRIGAYYGANVNLDFSY